MSSCKLEGQLHAGEMSKVDWTLESVHSPGGQMNVCKLYLGCVHASNVLKYMYVQQQNRQVFREDSYLLHL